MTKLPLTPDALTPLRDAYADYQGTPASYSHAQPAKATLLGLLRLHAEALICAAEKLQSERFKD